MYVCVCEYKYSVCICMYVDILYTSSVYLFKNSFFGILSFFFNPYFIFEKFSSLISVIIISSSILFSCSDIMISKLNVRKC